MKIIEGGLERVKGFTCSAVECGIKYEGRLDFSLIFSRRPCNAAGVFTTNRIFAAPVRLCRERISGPVHGILINATNANACTGETGYRNALELTRYAEDLLSVPSGSLLAASTGVIGVQLPMEKMKKSLPSLVGGLSPGNGILLPKAIMTTDTFPKAVAASFTTSMGEFSVAGTAKGSGMIAPDMATLLCFILTDAPVGRKELDAIFRRCVRQTLNSITIDGDMSTNDTAIVLSPATEMALSSREDLSAFEESLLFVLSKLADLLVRDAEGATKLITVNVKGAKSPEDARRAARSVAESLLVKTAMFGRDPNWGRIACAAGYSGAEVEEKSLSILFEDVLLLDRGTPASCDRRRLGEILSRREVTVTVDLGLGNHAFAYLTSDISYDYVKINAEYTT